jgi:hypothetical protein
VYAGIFNQNAWLRTFIRSDIVDDYERNCLDIVNKYKDKETTPETILGLFNELQYELDRMAQRIVREIESE